MDDWISVEDELPSGENNIIISNGNWVSEAVYDTWNKIFLDAVEEYQEYKNVTHWMPLPEPPNNTGEK